MEYSDTLLPNSVVFEKDSTTNEVLHLMTIAQVCEWLFVKYNIYIELICSRIKQPYQFSWNTVEGFDYADEMDELPYNNSKTWYKTIKEAYIDAIQHSFNSLSIK